MGGRLSRRRFLQSAVASGAVVALRAPSASASSVIVDLDFAAGASWTAGWHLDGIGNLLTVDRTGVLQAGTRIAPADSRVTAFAADRRTADATIIAVVERTGILAGTVLRRVGPQHQYQAVLASGGNALKLVRRTPDGGEVDLAATQLTPLAYPCTLTFTATGSAPSSLSASVTDAAGRTVSISAVDDTPSLGATGDPGVLATSEIVSRAFPLAEAEVAAIDRDIAETVTTRHVVERLSTAVFSRITVTSSETPGTTTPSFVAASTGVPVDGGAHLRVVTDVPSDVAIDLATSPDFTDATTVALGATNARNAIIGAVTGLAAGSTVHWRPRAAGVVGPARSFRVLPGRGDATPVTIAVGSCAEEVGPTFAAIAAEAPDLFVWEGDLLYPDYVGPLMQTSSGYAGWWKALLSAPALQPLLTTTAFATQRDDHDYGANNLTGIPEHGVEPYESVLHPQKYYAFSAGVVDAWVLDQRWWRSPSTDPDTPDKTLLGAEQRAWLFDGLQASDARFKLVCSPDPLFFPTNRDTSWGKGYTAERDLLLDHIAGVVSGRTVFVTGDSHSAAVVDTAGVLEVRASPMHTANHPASSGDGVVFSDTGHFFCLVRADGAGLEISLVRDDGSRAWSDIIT